MKHFKNNQVSKSRSDAGSYKWFLIMGLLINAVVFVYLNYSEKYLLKGIACSFADYFLICATPYLIAICVIPVSLFLANELYGMYEHLNIVVRCKSYCSIWFALVRRAGGVSMVVSVITTMSVMVHGMYRTDILINFSMPHSVFSFYNNGNTIAEPSIILVVLIFGLYIFTVLLMSNLLLYLLKWINIKAVFSFLISYICLYLIFFVVEIPYFTSIQYGRWYPNRNFCFRTMFFICMLLAGSGWFYQKRKEFLHEV